MPAQDHAEIAETMLRHLDEQQDPRNEGYGAYATAALAHAVLALVETASEDEDE